MAKIISAPEVALSNAWRRTKPASYLAYAALAVLSAAVTFMSWTSDPLRGIVVAIAIIIIGALSTLVGRFVATKNSALGLILTWFIALFSMSVTLIAFSIIAFGVPSTAATHLGRFLHSATILAPNVSSAAKVSGPISGLDPSNTSFNVEGDIYDRLAALRIRKPLLVSNSRLSLDGASDNRTIVASAITLHDASIVLNGGRLVIETFDVDAQNNAKIVSFDGNAAGQGTGAGELVLVIHGRILGTLTIELIGQDGEPGKNGLKGPKGANGAQGDRAASSVFDCKRGPGRGQAGAPGLAGENGSPGFDGGDGGRLIIVSDDPQEILKHIKFVSKGGVGGAGGKGGTGGDGGSGGNGGDSSGLCSGRGPRGPDGPQGPNGLDGTQGKEGQSFSISFIAVSDWTP